MNNITIYQISTVALILLVIFLGWKSCNTKSDKDLPPTIDYTIKKDSVQQILDSVNKRADNNLDSAGNVNNLLAERIQDLSQKQKDAEASATFWAMKYRLARKDTSGVAVVVESCDSVVRLNTDLIELNARLRDEWSKKDDNYRYQLRVRDTLQEQTDLAYNSVVDLVVQSNEALSAYKQAARPRASLYIGAVGSSNILYTVGGLGLLYRGKGGKTIVNASYSVGNIKPLYSVGIYKRISFRKK